MKRIRIKLIVVSLIAVTLTFITEPTLAYFSTVGRATNVITSGEIRMIIHETTDQGTEFPEEGVYVIPGDVVSKEVSVESDCDEPFYLRVKMLYGINSQALSSEDCFKLNIDPEHWTLYDGWYYYNEVVGPHETTPKVFSHVEIVGSKVDNRYIGKALTLTVKAEAVQAKNNPITDKKTYTAVGWPAE